MGLDETNNRTGGGSRWVRDGRMASSQRSDAANGCEHPQPQKTRRRTTA